MEAMKEQKEGCILQSRYLTVPDALDLDTLVGQLDLFPYQSGGNTVELNSFSVHDDGFVNLTIMLGSRIPDLEVCNSTIPPGHKEVHIYAAGTSKETEAVANQAKDLLAGAESLDVDDNGLYKSIFENRFEILGAEKRYYDQYCKMVGGLSETRPLEDKQLILGPLTLILGYYVNVGLLAPPDPGNMYAIRSLQRREGEIDGKKVRVSLYHLSGPVLSGIYGSIALMPFEKGCPDCEEDVCNQAEYYSGYYTRPSCLLMGVTHPGKQEYSGGDIPGMVLPAGCLTVHGNIDAG